MSSFRRTKAQAKLVNEFYGASATLAVLPMGFYPCRHSLFHALSNFLIEGILRQLPKFQGPFSGL
jgi:hypothetical protein